MKKQLLLFSILSALLCFFACNKQASVLTEANVRTDKMLVTKVDTVLSNETPLTLFVVRHAEKQEGDDPSLTDIGKQRANDLAHLLEKVPIDAIYSSNYKRTQETAMPTASQKNISITTYDARQLSHVAADLLATQASKTVLLVGHSNTNPDLINVLTQTKNYPHLTEKQYDDIFLLRIHSLGDTEVLHLKYGTESE